MEKSIFTFMYIAAFPFAFMPSIVAMFVRHRHKFILLFINFVVWVGLYFTLRAVVSNANDGISIPIPIALVTWLILFRLAIKGERRDV